MRTEIKNVPRGHESPKEFVYIHDERKHTFLLVPSAKIAYRMNTPSLCGYASMRRLPSRKPGRSEIESLGHKVIAGETFEGSQAIPVLLDGSRASSEERWISNELGIVGSLKTSVAGQPVIIDLQTIARTPSPEELFLIPGDYKVADMLSPTARFFQGSQGLTRVVSSLIRRGG